MMNEAREKMIDRMIRIYGFEHEVVIAFAKACESNQFADEALEVVVKCHEENPIGFDEDEE